MLRYVATIRPDSKNETYPKASAPCYAARLVLNVDTAYAIERLDRSADAPLKTAKDCITRQAAYDAVAYTNLPSVIATAVKAGGTSP